MMKIGQVTNSYLTKGVVCVIDDYEHVAVRLLKNGSETDVFIKRKGKKEIPSRLETDIVQKTLNELNNREVSVESTTSTNVSGFRILLHK